MFAKIAHELPRAIFDDSLLQVGRERIAFDSQHLELIEKAQLCRQLFELILVHEQFLQVGEHANLRRQIAQIIERQVQHRQRAHVADIRRQPRELVVVEVNLVQMWVVFEDARSHALETVTAKIHGIPLACLFNLVCGLHPPPLAVLVRVGVGADG